MDLVLGAGPNGLMAAAETADNNFRAFFLSSILLLLLFDPSCFGSAGPAS